MKNLKTLIRCLISESFEQNLISEADITGHSVERFYDRFLAGGEKNVGFEIPGTTGEYEIVGTKEIGEDVVNEIKRRFDIIGKYNFPKNNSYAIKIADLYIKPETVSFKSEELKNTSSGKTLLYVDLKTASNGNHIYLIIRDNKAVTVFFAKSYSKIDKSKFQVDFIIQDFGRVIKREVR
jgi:hypothetical protein